jgi:putative heme iron utilization protein
MSETITPAISDRICRHMNRDHQDEIVLYAKTFGNAPQTETATMDSIDSQGMNISAQIAGETVPVRVEFDHTLKDSKDAKETLVAMIQQAETA